MESSALAAHLGRRYRIDVDGITAIESVHRIDRRDGPSWIARVFPPERPLGATEGDAEILQFLETERFPAERCADAEPVSVFEDQAVLVTGCLDGPNGRPDLSAGTLGAMGDLLGRLQTLPDAAGATARPAGSWHHLPDFVTANVILTGDGPTLVDWTGAGRGPRVAALGQLLSTTAGDPRLVDAIVAGYRPHVALDADELKRLGGAVRAFGLILDCWTALHYEGLLPHVVGGLAGSRTTAEAIADRARSALR
jgi:Ser/Thr protein kinase RdoA (MazF antagonist)